MAGECDLEGSLIVFRSEARPPHDEMIQIINIFKDRFAGCSDPCHTRWHGVWVHYCTWLLRCENTLRLGLACLRWPPDRGNHSYSRRKLFSL